MKRNKTLYILLPILIMILSFLNYKTVYIRIDENTQLEENKIYIIDKLTKENKSFLEFNEIYNKYTDLENEEKTDNLIDYYNKKYIEKTIYNDDEMYDNKRYNNSYSDNNDLTLSALSASLIDPINGRVLYNKAGNEPMPMASTTKIMTCIIALENGKLNDEVKISKYAATMPKVKLNVREDEVYYLKDLLYSLMLESHNDVAVAIAEHIGGTVEGFAKLMNDKAKELNCENTNFITPSGLDANNHITTAIELGRIASYAIKNENFINIINTDSWNFSELTKNRNHIVHNKDRFLYLYDGAFGIKTGFTNKAGYCFVGAVNKKGKTFISVVLGSGWPPYKNYKWKDTTVLMDYGVNNYNVKEIFNYGKTFEPLAIKNGQKKYLHLYHFDNIIALIKSDEIVKVIYSIPRTIEAPIKSNTIIGSADYYIGDDFIKSVPILSAEKIDKIDFMFCFNKIINLWTL